MAVIAYNPRALRDLDRIVGHLVEHQDATAAHEALALITEAVQVLARHPFIGPARRGQLRELVISRGRTGYVALYRVQRSRVEILSVRHQGEAGFP